MDKLSWQLPIQNPEDLVGWLVKFKSPDVERYAVIKKVDDRGEQPIYKGEVLYWGIWSDSEEEAIEVFEKYPRFRRVSQTGGHDSFWTLSKAETIIPIRKIF